MVHTEQVKRKKETVHQSTKSGQSDMFNFETKKSMLNSNTKQGGIK